MPAGAMLGKPGRCMVAAVMGDVGGIGKGSTEPMLGGLIRRGLPIPCNGPSVQDNIFYITMFHKKKSVIKAVLFT